MLWWSLAFGGDLGGNLTAVGSSANIVMLGIALRSGNPISFWEFTRKGIVITTISTVLCALYSLAALLRPRLSGQRVSSATHSM